jgi:hypothetical protein
MPVVFGFLEHFSRALLKTISSLRTVSPVGDVIVAPGAAFRYLYWCTIASTISAGILIGNVAHIFD